MIHASVLSTTQRRGRVTNPGWISHVNAGLFSLLGGDRAPLLGRHTAQRHQRINAVHLTTIAARAQVAQRLLPPRLPGHGGLRLDETAGDVPRFGEGARPAAG
ncbi:hypothetical protein [Streptomyces syringium]|uniref:hypothetical protein n=1 Tax=Streptomyces syringium TaxID=76729 RepID=UPI0033B0634C